ncbi:G-type lectin S-receptor-like serine/threonine-protein kinase LECRK1 [Alnus glutinosa]|uniref:G-type lectin S-receptor-like serine/threonine-protein kinase LECRK1 n=1 Tax=Alnus glutinosa TaxID=3517 RepID=UPI002D795342|nr:G-type lectin S-receptor-like serine/threonine-protein kinase LECRK1 [Alnus glutinosa]
MASIPVLLLLLVFLLPDYANAQRNQTKEICLGSSLSPNENRTSWLSASGYFAFGFYPRGDGFAIGIWLINQNEKTVTWTANRDYPPVSSNATLDLTRDGLLLRAGPYNISDDLSEPAVSAAMLDSGNFVLYNYNSDVIWQTYDFPTDTILGGQTILGGHDPSADDYGLVSSVSKSNQSTGRYSLLIQHDRELVARPVNSSDEFDESYDTFWFAETKTRSAETTAGGPFIDLTLNLSGVLFLRGMSVRILASSHYPDNKNGTIIHRATLDADGIFRLYVHQYFESDNSSSMLVEWKALASQCEVSGFCGFNSYCSVDGNKALCNCFPGFHFVNTSNKFLGCFRNFDDNAFTRSENPAMQYGVDHLENIMWSDYPYSVVQMKKEDCGKSCLEDCNCAAVLYTGGSCNKYKLPLRYSRVSKNISATAFFKVIRRIPVGQKVLPESKRGLVFILAITLGSIISCLCVIFAIYTLFRYRHQVYRYRSLSENTNLELIEEFALRPYSYNELEKATEGFKEELGKGSFGVVYKGTISGGNKTIAVKRLEKIVEEGHREFRAEITAIARTHHRNLVRLLGFCIEGTKKLLVYDFMSNGSLADLLFKAEMRPIWKERVRIARDVARGILYLHEECEVHIIHCNIKPQNILMDDTWTAKISDFGLAKQLLPNQSRTAVEAPGTTGYFYLAPEWKKNALISVKADIYSFGIVLLEIVCCRSSIEVNVPIPAEINLFSWVYNCFMAGELDKLVEDEEVDFVTLERMVKVGLWCIQEDPALRPSMKNVILMLEGTMDIPVPPSVVGSLV